MLAQGAWALSAALAVVIFLLLLGTQILDWQWLIVLPTATLGLGAWLTIRRLPSAYRIAQLIDTRLGLADSLSTALFFGTEGRERKVQEGVRAMQKAEAERLAAGIDLRAAIPFTLPRAIYSVAILGVAASSLFALRYGLDHQLSLQKPLASIIQQAFGLDQQQAAALDRKQPVPPPERKRLDMQDMQGVSVEDGQLPRDGQLEAGEALNVDGTKGAADQNKQGAARSATRQQNGSEQGDEMDAAGQESSGVSSGAEEQGREGKQGKQGKEGGQQSGDEHGSGDSSNNSLLSKFREAMQNMMSRMRQPQSGGQGGQQQSAKNEGNRQGKQQAGEGREGQQQGSGQEGQGQDGQPGSQAQSAQNASGRGSGQSGEENASKQPGSGMGRQDGDKDLKNAEQLAAMGKLSEIIGKRSANLTGEVTVEVQSSRQQLQTPYSQRRATQGETIAEISRDEVPVALESYVQQYFEQVRRKAESTAAARR
ncbi:MAG TPA: hypothetical protein VN442_22855 [Bryobacteraceae bacterium]|nr:hypothetical protein [Bryobacteraceae bacterium]